MVNYQNLHTHRHSSRTKASLKMNPIVRVKLVTIVYTCININDEPGQCIQFVGREATNVPLSIASRYAHQDVERNIRYSLEIIEKIKPTYISTFFLSRAEATHGHFISFCYTIMVTSKLVVEV